ncbi:hypothetical protein RAJCM14343_2114 [Rhodococcus aetherivorans]|uniref:Uncharacterized protein n=1 Tax=Rhodococcus aetherivorans TaxID=191292 RepID=A0ABQ0YK79_9NOCA|nr:hypothetical protein RAJCM14343_2114 [Rhodococcus aetherivorans]CCW12784.1 hypothetical protein EBESD8_33360 [Rhodococcus aetherivorans]
MIVRWHLVSRTRGRGGRPPADRTVRAHGPVPPTAPAPRSLPWAGTGSSSPCGGPGRRDPRPGTSNRTFHRRVCGPIRSGPPRQARTPRRHRASCSGPRAARDARWTTGAHRCSAEQDPSRHRLPAAHPRTLRFGRRVRCGSSPVILPPVRPDEKAGCGVSAERTGRVPGVAPEHPVGHDDFTPRTSNRRTVPQ